MPHHSGGGSHGGGSHGGSHGSHGSSHRVSHHYFHGARRYRRVNRDGSEEYIYSDVRPAKTNLFGIVFLSIFGVIFTSLFGIGMSSSVPHRLKEGYRAPSHFVYDNIDVIDNDEELEDVIGQFYELTGICPVFYTEYQDSLTDFESVEDYAMYKYLDEFDDEQHFVIVYTIPANQAELLESGEIKVADFIWEAIQGDETDPIITGSSFRLFADDAQDELEEGTDPGTAFAIAFEGMTSRAKQQLSPMSLSRITGYFPIILVVLFFAFPLIVMIRSYIKDKGATIEEVPLSEEDEKMRATLPSGGAAYGTPYAELQNSGALKIVMVISVLFIVPFILAGVGMIAGGAATLSSKDPTGPFLLIFGIVWTLISLGIMVSLISTFRKRTKPSDQKPLTAEYPKAEYPKADYPEQEPVPSTPVSSRTDYDDEDYERMRRKGYE